MSMQDVADQDIKETVDQQDTHLADQEELNDLMLQQINIAKQIKDQRIKVAYGIYRELTDFLAKNKLSIDEFWTICENRHVELHGEKPTNLFKDMNFTQAGSKRVLDIKYQDKANPSNVWTGRGKQALWLTARIKEGYSKDDFLVNTQQIETTKSRRTTSDSVSDRSTRAANQKLRKTAKRPKGQEDTVVA